MAENKQYVLQEREKGNVYVSEDVIASIASRAISEVEGIAGTSIKPGAEIVEMFGNKYWGKGIEVAVAENQDVTIDCNVIVYYGQSIMDVSQAAQAAVLSAVEAYANVNLAAININVCGIVRK